MKVVIGFSRPKNEAILSKIIRKIEKRDFSHAYVRLPEPHGSQVIFQASGLAVNLMSFYVFSQIEICVEEYEMDITDMAYARLWAYMLARLGVPYSIIQLIRIFIHKLFGIKIGHNKEQAEICSELAARVCRSLGLSVPGDLDYETPSDLQKFISANLKRVL